MATVFARSSVWGAAALAASLSAAHAGPCAKQIDQMQARIDARLAALAASGAAERESVAATTDRQPTPGSIAVAEERVGELSAETIASVGHAMESARAADSAGDTRSCEQALAEVEHVLAARPAAR